MFEDLLQYLKAHGVNVVLLLPPIHPDAYRSWLQNPRFGITVQVETYLRELARRNNFKVAFDPSHYGFTNNDFSDAIHGHENVMKKLFEGFNAKDGQ